MGTPIVRFSVSKVSLLIALSTLALSPLASSTPDEDGFATATLIDRELGEKAPTSSPLADAIRECTGEFSSGSIGYCSRSWQQSGNVEYSWHQSFHDVYTTGTYSRLIWMDAANRMVFLRQCDHTATVQEIGWQDCPEPPTASTYREGLQTLYVYGESGSCSLGTCVVHGKLTFS